MDQLRVALTNLLPVIKSAQSELAENRESLEARCREAELEAYSWDLSAQKGAEMQLEEHAVLEENVVALKQRIIELVTMLD